MSGITLPVSRKTEIQTYICWTPKIHVLFIKLLLVYRVACKEGRMHRLNILTARVMRPDL